MRSTVSGVAVALAGLFALGCAADHVDISDPVDKRSSPIVNGQLHAGDPAVGVITAGGSLCTATLVGQRTVLTAGHCVRPGRQHYFVAANRYWPASEIIVHPGYKPPSTQNDIAVVLLRDAPTVVPAHISSKPPQVGQELKLVGFGQTSHGAQGRPQKRMARNAVAYLSQTRIVINGATGAVGNLCFGDSGGPTFATVGGHYVQVGVHSTISGQCGTQGHDMRVDVYREWILKSAKGDVSVDGDVTPRLDNVPPTVRITSPTPASEVPWRFYVETKVTDNRGVARVELHVDGKKLSERTAAPYRFDLEPGEGRHRLTVYAFDTAGNKAEAVADVTVLAPKTFGLACTESSECKSGICGRHGSLATGYCTELCDASSPCPSQTACLPAGGTVSACAPPPSAVKQNGDDSTEQRSGGCAVGGSAGSSDAAVVLILLAVGLVLSRRRRQR